MKILITGSAGFIGSHLAEFFLKEGHQVVGLDNFITGDQNNADKFSKYLSLNFIESDIADMKEDLRKKLEAQKFDEVYHLACPTGVPNLITLAEEMLLTNSLGTKNILDIARKNNSKVIVASSSEVYGDPLVFPQTEEYSGNVDPIGTRSPYEEGKRFGESLVSMYVRKYSLDARIVRIFNTYGPNMSLADQRVVPKLINQLNNNQPLTVHGNGSQKRTFCYITDLLDGVVLVMKQGTPGEVYNIGSEDEVEIYKLARTLIKISGLSAEIISEPRPSHDHQARMPDLTKIKKLGWQTKINLEEGLLLTLKQSQPTEV